MATLVYFSGFWIVLSFTFILYINKMLARGYSPSFKEVIEGMFSCLLLALGWPFFLVAIIWVAFQEVRRKLRQESSR